MGFGQTTSHVCLGRYKQRHALSELVILKLYKLDIGFSSFPKEFVRTNLFWSQRIGQTFDKVQVSSLGELVSVMKDVNICP